MSLPHRRGLLAVRHNHEDGRVECPFRNARAPVLHNGLAFAHFDTSPVTQGHMLLIPLRHIADWFDASADERYDLLALADEARAPC